MTSTTPTTPKPRRRWLQFRLRTLLVLMLVFGAAFSWFARELQQARQQARAQREAATAIRKLGGSVVCAAVSGGMMRTAVAWFGEFFGEDLSEDVISVGLGNKTHVTDVGLVHLQGLTQLRSLDLTNTQVTDAGLAHLQGLTQLRVLTLNYTQVTNAGLVHLRGLTQLKELCLVRTRVTDAGLVHLQGLTQLQRLDISFSRWVADPGLVHLQTLTQLQWLDLYETHVTGAGINELKKALPNVQITTMRY